MTIATFSADCAWADAAMQGLRSTAAKERRRDQAAENDTECYKCRRFAAKAATPAKPRLRSDRVEPRSGTDSDVTRLSSVNSQSLRPPPAFTNGMNVTSVIPMKLKLPVW